MSQGHCCCTGAKRGGCFCLEFLGKGERGQQLQVTPGSSRRSRGRNSSEGTTLTSKLNMVQGGMSSQRIEVQGAIQPCSHYSVGGTQGGRQAGSLGLCADSATQTEKGRLTVATIPAETTSSSNPRAGKRACRLPQQEARSVSITLEPPAGNTPL